MLANACRKVASLLVLCSFSNAFGHIEGLPEAACASILQEDPQRWLTLSGGSARYWPTEWGNTEFRTNWDFTMARRQSEQIALGCQTMGGRMWEVRLVVNAAVASNFTVCAPAVCNATEASSIVARAVIETAHDRRQSSGREHLPFTREEASQAKLTTTHELSPWRWVPLDFAIVGIHGCGTTSLFRNLLLHPQIAFTRDVEDGDLWESNLLPTVAYVGSLRKRKQALRSGQRMLLGMANPMMWKVEFVMTTLSLIPNLRVIMILCDPIRILEKFSWSGSDEAQADPPAPATAWWKLARRVLKEKGGALFGNEVVWLNKVAGVEFMVAHLAHLHNYPRETYTGLTSYLEIEDYPPEHVFRKFNTWHKNVEFCKNTSMLRRMRRLFDADYRITVEAISGSGWPIIPEIHSRQLQCEAARWECGAEYMNRRSAWDALSGGFVANNDSHQEALIAECDSMGGVTWQVHVQHAKMGKEGDVSICAPAVCEEEEVRDGVSHNVFKSRENPRGLNRPFRAFLEEDFTDLVIEVKSKRLPQGG